MREYRSYDNLEGKVAKAIKKTIKVTKGFELAAHMIALDIWNNTANQLRNPNDQDISRGIYEFFGNAR